MNRDQIWAAILSERERQGRKWAAVHRWGKGDCSSPLVDDIVKVAVLTEETGEVARAVMDEDPNLSAELIQVAAVAVAWLEGIDT